MSVKQSDIGPDIQETLKELDVSLDDVGNVAVTMACGFGTGVALGTIIPGIGNVVGGLIGATVGGILGVRRSYGGKGGKVRQKMNKVFKKSIESIKASANHSIANITDDLNKQENRILNQISLLQESFNYVDGTIRDLKHDLLNYCYKINILEYGRISI